jgi:hypothetical protein
MRRNNVEDPQPKPAPTEAAIIGDVGMFSLTGYPKSWYRKTLAEAKRKSRTEKKEQQ